MLDKNSSTLEIQSWFVPFDILMILSTTFTIIANIIFISIIILDRTCHTVPMMLTANTCLSLLVFGSIRMSMSVFVLYSDLQPIYYQYSSCKLLGYMVYVAYAVQNYSFFQQAFYRYMVVVYPTRFFWQSTKIHCLMICFTWVFAFVCCLPYILADEIEYNIPNYICQLRFGLSFFILYCMFTIYIVPMLAIMTIYLKLVRHVREMSQHVSSTNTLIRAQRELKIFRRTVIFVHGLIIIGLPYALFIFISFFTSPPKYHFRISYAFGDVLLPFLMIVLFVFTEPVKASVKKKINGRMNLVLPLAT